MSNPIYAIGDIHGQIEQLEQALELIHADGGAEAEIVFLGDLTDRGANSRAVLDLMVKGCDDGRNWACVKGNHDRLFHNFVRDGAVTDGRLRSDLTWLHSRMGGADTLASYGVQDAGTRPVEEVLAEARDAVPEAHLAYLDALPLWEERDAVLFVHAGIFPGVPLGAQTEDDLLWIRDGFLDNPAPHPWLIVHGHTALDCPHHYGNRIDLDGGAGYGRALIPAVFEGSECWLLTDKGREALLPNVPFC